MKLLLAGGGGDVMGGEGSFPFVGGCLLYGGTLLGGGGRGWGCIQPNFGGGEAYPIEHFGGGG